jgi:predicted transcriptional regulator
MGATKTENFTTKQNAIATLTKALGHPARVAIMEYLINVNTCICGDIVTELPLSQASISRHLGELKAAGLIKGTITGTSVCYCLNPENTPILVQFLNQLNSTTNQSCCS